MLDLLQFTNNFKKNFNFTIHHSGNISTAATLNQNFILRSRNLTGLRIFPNRLIPTLRVPRVSLINLNSNTRVVTAFSPMDTFRLNSFNAIDTFRRELRQALASRFIQTRNQRTNHRRLYLKHQRRRVLKAISNNTLLRNQIRLRRLIFISINSHHGLKRIRTLISFSSLRVQFINSQVRISPMNFQHRRRLQRHRRLQRVNLNFNQR